MHNNYKLDENILKTLIIEIYKKYRYFKNLTRSTDIFRKNKVTQYLLENFKFGWGK